MSERHTLHGTIGPHAEPAAPEVIARLAGHDTAKLLDSMGGQGAMSHEIKPLETSMRFAGTALTVLTRPGDALFVQRAIDETRPGDVVVIAADGYRDVSVIGERLGYFFKRNGARAIVVDGAVRDADGMVRDAPPTFARANCIRIFGSTGPGAVNVEISAGGQTVRPGDIVVGDRDGVVVIPRADAERVADLADAHLAGELARVQDVESGKSVTETFGLDDKIARWQDVE